MTVHLEDGLHAAHDSVFIKSRMEAIESLALMTQMYDDKRLVKSLMTNLADRDARIRSLTVRGISSCCSGNLDVIESVSPLLRHESSRVRISALQALGDIVTKCSDMDVSLLCECLGHPEYGVRREATVSLGKAYAGDHGAFQYCWPCWMPRSSCFMLAQGSPHHSLLSSRRQC